MQYPVNQGRDFNSIIDLLKMTMYKFPAGGGKPEKLPIPESEKDKANQLHNELVERAAENDENLMELYFQKAIATLPERQQLIFTMKYFGEHTYEELSEILGTTVGGLKSSYHIAVKKITEFIQTNEIT